ncbi:dihydrodipicolinate synthase family protein [Ruficoccus amylovorans]|uniref:Dihydrodipicolinate synthase family protein n=2 Tax=Ruficoccus amylovorans TaxID=1804625 RepID=A0A842HJ28_9BACT|nr:dihydrodipicolinate synthase family protein [Ruficoccus amylovorans]
MLTPFTPDDTIDWPAFDELVDWYVSAGASGLFSVCLSSELYHLSAEEKEALAKRALARVSGRVPVIAAGPMGPDLNDMAEQTRRMADTGVAAVILLTNQFYCEAPDEPDGSDSDWRDAVSRFLELVPDNIPLGIYECPRPFPCNLSAGTLGWLAGTGRFVMTKDTCCDSGVIAEKLRSTANTPLSFYNADGVTLLDSLRRGGAGYSGIAGNYFLSLFSWLCRHHAEQPALAEELSAFIQAENRLVHVQYPQSAKHYLGLAGLRLTPHTRVSSFDFSASQLEDLRSLRGRIIDWECRLGLCPSTTAAR